MVAFLKKDSYIFKIPGTEGRAGMVAIVDTKKSINLESFLKGMKEHLPSYSVPYFLRIMESLPMTGTFKLKKNDLQADGFNINKVKDQLYFLDMKSSKYVELTEDIYDKIMNNEIRL